MASLRPCCFDILNEHVAKVWPESCPFDTTRWWFAISRHLMQLQFAISFHSQKIRGTSETSLPEAVCNKIAQDCVHFDSRLRWLSLTSQHNDTRSHLKLFQLHLINFAGLTVPAISDDRFTELTENARASVARGFHRFIGFDDGLVIDAEAAWSCHFSKCQGLWCEDMWQDRHDHYRRSCLDAKVTTLSGPPLCLGLALEHLTDVGKLSVPFVMEGKKILQVRCEAAMFNSEGGATLMNRLDLIIMPEPQSIEYWTSCHLEAHMTQASYCGAMTQSDVVISKFASILHVRCDSQRVPCTKQKGFTYLT